MDQSEKIEEIFTRIRHFFDEMDDIREKVLPIQRKIVRACSEVIKKIHRKMITGLDTQLQLIHQDLIDLTAILDSSPKNFTTDYLQIVQQEYGEAAILFSLLTKNEFPEPEQIGIGLMEYAYALADVIGELRRYCTNSLREGQLEESLTSLNLMEKIYDQLFSLDYPSGLIPGLRNKIDQARGIIAKTEGELAVSSNILRLNRNLENYFKEKPKL
jgi:translin